MRTTIPAALLRPSSEWPVPCSIGDDCGLVATDTGEDTDVWVADPDEAAGMEWSRDAVCDCTLPAIEARVVHLLCETCAEGSACLFARRETAWALVYGYGAEAFRFVDSDVTGPDSASVPGLAACGDDRAAALAAIALACLGSAP